MRTKVGVITSAKMTGTVTVTVHRSVFHPLYKKRYRVSKKFMAGTNGLDLHEGDTVLIGEGRPMSKNKRFTVMEIVKKAPQVSELADEAAIAQALKSKNRVTASTSATQS